MFLVTDKECMDALMELCRMEEHSAIESALSNSAIHVFKMAQEYKGKTIHHVNFSTVQLW